VANVLLPTYAHAHRSPACRAAAGGEGTRIWKRLDPALQPQYDDGSQHVGVEVLPLRGPLPGLCRRETIEALLKVGQRSCFSSRVLQPYIEALWDSRFQPKHSRQTITTFLHFGVNLAYATFLAAGVRTFWVRAPIGMRFARRVCACAPLC
jgi:hypothetical protein